MAGRLLYRDIWRLWGILRWSACPKPSSSVESLDLMIAATAIAHDAILVTANSREFARVEGLQWEDWEAPSA